MALLHLLSGLKGELGLSLEMAHLQHGIRGAEGRQDALFVAGLAERLALPFHLREVDLPRTRAERGKGNIEAMGRDERYRFFAALAEERGIQKVATAHTRDDQVETLPMWLMRGSGKRGWGGMPPGGRRGGKKIKKRGALPRGHEPRSPEYPPARRGAIGGEAAAASPCAIAEKSRA